MLTFAGFQILAMILFGTTMYHLNTTTEERIEIIDGESKSLYDNV